LHPVSSGLQHGGLSINPGFIGRRTAA
jgi:hypothetical protein